MGSKSGSAGLEWRELARPGNGLVPSRHSGIVPSGLSDDPAEGMAQGVPPECGMEEGGVQVDGVIVTTSLFADVEHAGPAQVAYDAPNGAPRQGHGVGDFVDGAVRVSGNVEKQSAVTGGENPLIALRSHFGISILVIT